MNSNNPYQPPSSFGSSSCQPMAWRSPNPPNFKNNKMHHHRPFGMTPEGLRMPRNMQFPPMFGPRGSTIHPRFINNNYNKKYPNSGFKDQKEQFWCDPCDRSFMTEELLKNHNKEHQKCGIDNCEFTAHFSVISKHIQMQHNTGLYKKICKTDTPEDIQNWINERKRNYPTKENIEKRRAQESECIDRGEKLKEDKSRFNKKSGFRSDNRNQKRFQGRKDYKSEFREKFKKTDNKSDNVKNKGTKAVTPIHKKFDSKPIISSQDFSEDFYCGLKAFKGTSQLIRDEIINEETATLVNDLDIEDNEWKDNCISLKNDLSKELKVCSALGNLISAYDSSDNEEPEEQPTLKTIPKIGDEVKEESQTAKNIEIIPKINDDLISDVCNIDSSNKEIITDDNFSALTDKVGDIKSNRKRTRKRKNSNSEVAENAPKKVENGIEKNKRVVRQPIIRRLPKTLLEKLLEKDIRSERNMVLQCVHYIVSNNFFKEKDKTD